MRCARVHWPLIRQTAFAASAQETIIGHVRKVTGVATIIRGDERVRVLSGLPVLAKDVIETGSNGTIGVTFSDNTVFSAGPNSRIVMEQFSFDSKSFKGSLLARMDRGTLSVVSGDIARHSKDAMKIKTPSVVLGVRGTTFASAPDLGACPGRSPPPGRRG